MYYKKVFSTFLILGGVLFYDQSYGQVKPLTLEEAINYAFENAYSMQLSDQDIKIAAAQTKEVEGKAGPKVNLQGNYTRNGTENPPSRYLDNFSLTIAASTPLDISGMISLGVRGSRYGKMISEKSKDQQKINLKADVKNGSYNILLNSRILKLYRDRQETAENSLKNIVAKVENKVAAKYDQYIATREMESSKSAVLNSELSYKASKKTFNNLIGREVDQEFELQEITELPQLEINKSKLLNECHNRPDVQAINYNIELQKCMYQAELKVLAPSLGVSLSYNKVQKLTSKSSPNSHLLTGGLALTVPILDSGVAKARAEQVEENIKKLEIQKKQLLGQIEVQLNNALDQLKNACQQMEVIKSGLAAAKEAYRIALLRFNESQSIQLELSSARDSLTQVNIDYDTSFFNILKAYNEIERITGVSIKTLSEK